LAKTFDSITEILLEYERLLRLGIQAVAIGAHLSNEILEYKDELIAVLDKCRTDKVQPVRAAAQETLKLLKELEVQNQRSFEESDFD
jgi:hypothetical protein